jgi:hypothetical protein
MQKFHWRGIADRLCLLVIGIATIVINTFFFAQIIRSTSELPQRQKENFLQYITLMPPTHMERSVVAVMIENHEGARPHQIGLRDALLIDEMLVEGGISRFAVLFDRENIPALTGPLRSLRPYFVDTILPWSSVILHAGGSPEAFDEVAKFPSLTAINALAYGGKAFRRIALIPAPHNLFVVGPEATKLLPEKRMETLWPPYDIGSMPQDGSGALFIDVNFFSRRHNVLFSFNKSAQTYTRDNGGIVSEARPRNVFIFESFILDIGEHGRLTIDMSGHGAALFARGGKMFRGTWSKKDPKSPLQFMLFNSEPMRFSRGQTWMMVIPSLDRVTWTMTR